MEVWGDWWRFGGLDRGFRNWLEALGIGRTPLPSLPPGKTQPVTQNQEQVDGRTAGTDGHLIFPHPFGSADTAPGAGATDGRTDGRTDRQLAAVRGWGGGPQRAAPCPSCPREGCFGKCSRGAFTSPDRPAARSSAQKPPGLPLRQRHPNVELKIDLGVGTCFRADFWTGFWLFVLDWALLTRVCMGAAQCGRQAGTPNEAAANVAWKKCRRRWRLLRW